MKIFCIHGNFQTAKVWQTLEERMKAGFSDLEMITEELCAKQFQSFDNWTEDFCGVWTEANGEKSILRFSLGGRLALHAVFNRRPLGVRHCYWADPGLESEEEKKVQLHRDREWAERLKKEDWKSWSTSNAQFKCGDNYGEHG